MTSSKLSSSAAVVEEQAANQLMEEMLDMEDLAIVEVEAVVVVDTVEAEVEVAHL